MGLNFVVKLLCQTSPIMSSLGIKYSTCEVIRDVIITMRNPRSYDMGQISDCKWCQRFLLL